MENDVTKVRGPRFRVGEWQVESALHRMAREGGEVVQVEPKVMEVLVRLAAEAPGVVTGDELLAAVWGSAYVSEDLPRRAVYQLRKIFEDDPRQPTYIETIPRAGYRLVAPVLWPAPASEEIGGDASPSPPGRRWVVRWGWAALALILATGVSLVWLRRTRPVETALPRVTPLTSLPGLEYDPVLSPDGSRVAFLRAPDSAVDGEVALHVQLVSGGPSLRLSETPADFDHPIESPTWSPDGTRIAFLRWRRSLGWGIFEIPALGGAERKILELGPRGAAGLAWSPNGEWLALGLSTDDGDPGREGPLALHRLSLATLALEPLTEPPATSIGDRLPAWSPDGRTIAFVRTLGADASELRVVPASGGESRTLLPGRRRIADLDWTADGRRVQVAAFEGGSYRLRSVELATGLVRHLPAVGENLRWLSVSRRGERLVYGQSRYEIGFRRVDLASGSSTPLPALSSTFRDEALDVSQDGERVAFASTRSGSSEIWISDLAGRRPLRLTGFGNATASHPRWQSGGERIVFHADPEGQFDLWSVEVEGGPPRPLAVTPWNEKVPSFSRDGRSLYFASDRSGGWQIWRMPAGTGGGPASQVTRLGGYFARESPDGRWLYYSRWQTDGLWRLPLASLGKGGREERVLVDEPRSWEWGNWVPTPEGIWVVTRGASNQVFLTRFSAENGAMQRQVPLPGTPIQPSLALAPAGDSLYLTQVDRIDSDIVLVEGGIERP